MSLEITRQLLSPQIATEDESPTHYGYGVWIDRPNDALREFHVEGLDPGVALKSAVYPSEGVILTMIGNTNRALWSLHREIVTSLAL